MNEVHENHFLPEINFQAIDLVVNESQDSFFYTSAQIKGF